MGFEAFDLSGRVALITGGNAGIGLGIASGLAKAGADVCIWGTNERKNNNAVQKLSEHGVRVYAIKCNVAEKEEVEKAFSHTLELFGRVDGCFVNAGIGTQGGLFEEQAIEQWNQTLGVNLFGYVYVLQQAVKHMKERARKGDSFGRLVTTASLAGVQGMPYGQDYAASKGAVFALTNSLAVEFARYGITANTIIPGWIETEMTEKSFQSEKLVANVKARIPMRSFGKPDDFSGLAIYLMSPASNYHTGDIITIDGGYHTF